MKNEQQRMEFAIAREKQELIEEAKLQDLKSRIEFQKFFSQSIDSKYNQNKKRRIALINLMHSRYLNIQRVISKRKEEPTLDHSTSTSTLHFPSPKERRMIKMMDSKNINIGYETTLRISNIVRKNLRHVKENASSKIKLPPIYNYEQLKESLRQNRQFQRKSKPQIRKSFEEDQNSLFLTTEIPSNAENSYKTIPSSIIHIRHAS